MIIDSTDERQMEDAQCTSNTDEIRMEDVSKRNEEENATPSNTSRQNSLEHKDESLTVETEASINPDTPYEKLSLGLVMTLALKLSGNIKTAAITAISLNIFVSSFDTTSDIGMSLFYLYQELPTLALLVLLCDYLPGVVVLAHHMGSDSWQSSTRKEKTYAILTLACQPFSLLITNIGWLLDISSKKKHRLARLSTVLHGCLEAPMQFMILLFAQSKGIVPLPWMQTTSISDSNDNVLHLGQITIFSLTFSCIGLLKAASECFEIRSFKRQVLAAIYAMVHQTYRVFSMIYTLIVLGIFSAPLFGIVVLVNYVVLMYNDQHKRKWASTVSSLAVSVFLPIWISESPENFQIREDVTDEDEPALRQREKEETKAKQLVSFRLALFSTPMLLVTDAVAYYCLAYTDFKQDTVWSNGQLLDCFTIFLCPMFLLTMICSFAFSHLCEENSSAENNCRYLPNSLLNTRFWKRAKKFVSYASLVAMIAVFVVFGSLVDNLERTNIAFVSDNNELIVVPIINKGKLAGCDGNQTNICQNLKFNDSNFRNQSMVNGVGYIQRLPKQTVDMGQIEARKTSFFDLTAMQIWNKDAPKELRNAKPHCKRCLVNSIICNQFLHSIQDVERCDGKLTILSPTKCIL